MAKDRVYLDWNATARPESAALQAMAAAASSWANPSSVHTEGRRAKALLEDCRERVASHLGAVPHEVVFTSGGTEALALALSGVSATRRICSAVEHAAVFAAAPDAVIAPVTRDGVVDLDRLEPLLHEGALVALMHANNETGVLQPVDEVIALAHSKGAMVLVDAVQTAGKLDVPRADFVAVSAHKLGGPPAVGALVVRCASSLSPVQKGGGQERGLRGGTENLPGIAGFAAALSARAADDGWVQRAGRLRDRLEARLGAEVIGAKALRLPTTTMVRMAGVPAATQLIQLDLAGFAVSSGSACSSGKVGRSHVLEAMGAEHGGECIRVSLGWTTTEAEVDAFAAAWLDLAARKRAA